MYKQHCFPKKGSLCHTLERVLACCRQKKEAPLGTGDWCLCVQAAEPLRVWSNVHRRGPDSQGWVWFTTNSGMWHIFHCDSSSWEAGFAKRPTFVRWIYLNSKEMFRQRSRDQRVFETYQGIHIWCSTWGFQGLVQMCRPASGFPFFWNIQ